jgi:exosortase/archaeosortase family protein
LKSFLNKRILIYLVKFIGAFCVLYFGTLAIIGLSSPVGYYSSFVDKYLNFIPAFRNSFLQASKYFLSFFGYECYQSSPTQLCMVGGGAVNLVYSCLGYGVISFWIAFVFANTGSIKKKLAWMLGGAAVLYIINVVRISLVLLANGKHWHFPFGWDNHTWFNIVAYAMIFLMIWVYDRKQTPTAP